MQKITKAVIPCGGLGTRFLPATKAVPKELLPVIDTPVLFYIVEEAVKSGITDIRLILGEGKEPIKTFFTPNTKLEDLLLADGKKELYDCLKTIGAGAEISFGYQDKPLGTGDAVMRARDFTGDEPFVLSWGDDLIYAEKPVMGQLINCFDKTGTNVLGVQYIPGDDISMYGVADGDKTAERTYRIHRFVEKPKKENVPPSRLASLGRYVLTPDIYGRIEKLKPSVGGEIQLTDALAEAAKEGKVYAYDFEGLRFDMGDKLGALKASVFYGLKNAKFGQEFQKYLTKVVNDGFKI